MSGSSQYTRDDIGQAHPIEAQQDQAARDILTRPLQVGEMLPAVCGVQEVARVLGRSVSRVHQLQRLGKLRVFELEPLGDRRVRYNGRLLQEWVEGTLDRSFINGQLKRPRTFGRKRTA